ncbi:hypothetical protein BJ508DRAFT_313311 [Ascobolus immersus RN42]|uniref:Uncharacterized protein n=1 Tax=Ascobolus immersus RN42 TaxID=1160509 RepID=A0A3N4HN90_ASCIM|nr:hypothetical protein BJ508DRAFT_313311 [Ascobolus immersus RN42]
MATVSNLPSAVQMASTSTIAAASKATSEAAPKVDQVEVAAASTVSVKASISSQFSSVPTKAKLAVASQHLASASGIFPPHFLATLTSRESALILRHHQFLGSPPLTTFEEKEAFVKRCGLVGKSFLGKWCLFVPRYTKPFEAIPEWGQRQRSASAWETPWGGYNIPLAGPTYPEYAQYQYASGLDRNPQVPMGQLMHYPPSQMVSYQGSWTGQPVTEWSGNAVEMPMDQYPGRAATEQAVPARGTENGFDVTVPEFVPVTGNGVTVDGTEQRPAVGTGNSFDVTAPEFMPAVGDGVMVDGEGTKVDTEEGTGVTDSGDASATTNP